MLIERASAILPKFGFHGFDIDTRFVVNNASFWNGGVTKRMYYILKLWEGEGKEILDGSIDLNTDKGHVPLKYCVSRLFKSEFMHVHHIPLLVPERRKNSYGIDLAEAHSYLNDGNATYARKNYIYIHKITQEKLDMLLQVIGNGMQATYEEKVLGR